MIGSTLEVGLQSQTGWSHVRKWMYAPTGLKSRLLEKKAEAPEVGLQSHTRWGSVGEWVYAPTGLKSRLRLA